MKTLIYGGLSLALLCGSAMAQSSTPSPGIGGPAGTPLVTEGTQGSESRSDRGPERNGDGDRSRPDRKDWDKGDRRGPPHDRDRRDDRGDCHHGPRGDWKKDDRMGDGYRGRGHGPHHARMHGVPGEAGASFKFDRGGRGGSIEIKCATGESTEACVEAIMPLVETIMQGRDRDD